MLAAMPKRSACNQHGGNIETSPFRGFGEVSNAIVERQGSAILLKTATGTAVALDYISLGVAPHLPSSTGRGGARNRADRESHALTATQVANLVAATKHANAIGLPFTRMISIHWQTAGVPLSGMAKATGRFLDLMTKWLARQNHQTAWIWVHENGNRKGWHSHLLAHVPAKQVKWLPGRQKRWLKAITGNTYRKSVICSRPIGGWLGIEASNPELHAVNLQAALGYLCKCAPQAALDGHSIVRLHESGGRIIGRRCSTSQNIGATARSKSEKLEHSARARDT